jgi:uncharacterized protein (UPF0276 family)
MIGIGFRKDFADTFLQEHWDVDFIEVAPENWMNIGGYWRRVLEKALMDYPLFCHGLSLSIGGPDQLDLPFLKSLKVFLDRYQPVLYSEHLSFSTVDNVHLFDLLPMPFSKEAVNHVVERINYVQDILHRPLTLENISYYSSVEAEMTEAEFISEVVRRSGCKLLLDVNNVYVNAFNHTYDAHAFIHTLPLETVSYIHMAGHEQVSDTLIIDTHGSKIIDPVYDLLSYTLQHLPSNPPILLERDFNFTSMEELLLEVRQLKEIQQSIIQTKTSHASI